MIKGKLPNFSDVTCDNSLKDDDNFNIISKDPCKSHDNTPIIKEEENRSGLEAEGFEPLNVGNSELFNIYEEKPKLYEESPNATVMNVKWIPPRSPYNLIQESLFYKPWQLLIATIFLNKTTARVAVPLFWKFVSKWSTPESLQEATIIEIAALMKPLGLNVRRAIQIKRFTYDFLYKSWCYPKELAGIGKYGDDSYRIFCVNEWKNVKPQDSKLKKYVAWLRENYDKLTVI